MNPQLIFTILFLCTITWNGMAQTKPSAYELEISEENDCPETTIKMSSSDTTIMVTLGSSFKNDTLSIFVNNKKIEEAIFTSDKIWGIVRKSEISKYKFQPNDEIRIARTNDQNDYISFTINKKFYSYLICKLGVSWYVTMSNCIYIYK